MTQDAQKAEKKTYKATLNLPQTPFPMKANLVQNEPASMKRWAEQKLYAQLRARAAEKKQKRYVFHDGPPYANGSIHLGHLLNKVLKDIVVRSKTMAGYDVPYVPGWDCHGLPIEHKVVAELGPKAREMEAFQIRRKCQAYAEKFVKLQRGQMERLLTMADYENPYLTMTPDYEGAALEVFAQLIEKGLVYRALKPVHWSIANQTALADAELEYEDRVDTSVYVLFELVNPDALEAACGFADTSAPVHLMIWTTTPWTLPANLAVAAASSAEYGVYRVKRGNADAFAVIACDLAPKVLGMGNAPVSVPLATLRGKDLVHLRYRHPFIARTSPVVLAEYVTLEDGTGLVHTAPGHGVEDYQTGLKDFIRFNADRSAVVTGKPMDPSVRADTYCPVKENGSFDANDPSIPDWLKQPGIDVWKANDLVVSKLRESGHLFHSMQFTHSYPHDWRSKTPVIFRATEQWFVSVDLPFTAANGNGSIRQRSIASCDTVKFYPDWGKNRLRGMLESRPDWCISRQRAWGLPIPAFFNEKGEVLLTPASVRAVRDVVAKQGSDAWFKLGAAELLASYDAAKDPQAPAWLASSPTPQASSLHKGSDIFDVWFDSGVSWAAVIRQRNLGHDTAKQPITDLYLEGSDQHRGWFQASLLPAIATTGRPPYAAVLTHGFMVDKYGRKMSKSVGMIVMADQVRANLEADEQLAKKMKPEAVLDRLGLKGKKDGEEVPSAEVTARYESDAELKKLLSPDDLRKKLSNSIEVEDLIPRLGADVARWWVCSLNTDNDIKVDWKYFELAGEEYRKVRNTIRYLLSNLYDFAPGKDAYVFTEKDATSLDAWALSELNTLIKAVRDGYETFQFPRVREALFAFCNETMSAVYLAATKDRMYCDAAGSPRRRRTQTAMFTIAEALVKLVAPILPHTADEAWALLHKGDASVHLQLLPDPANVPVDADWAKVIAARDAWLKAIEEKRSGGGIENPLDTGLRVAGAGHDFDLAKFDRHDLADLCNVSRFELVEGATRDGATKHEVTDLRNEPRCERSWKRDGTVKPRSDGGLLSDRDAAAVGVA